MTPTSSAPLAPRLAEPVTSKSFELLTVVRCAVVSVIHRGVDTKRDGQEAE
jgi:hypothetical protein